MFDEAKKLLQGIAHHHTDHELKKRAGGAIELGVNLIKRELENVPENRVPCPKIAKEIQKLRTSINKMLEPIGIKYTELKEAKEIQKIECARAQLTLERYVSLMKKSEKVNPFGSLYEIYHAVENVNFQENEHLHTLFQDAIKTLFMHPQFAPCLIEKIHKKIELLAEAPTVGNTMMHHKIHLFLNNYPTYKQFNRILRNHPVIDTLMQELDAALYFEEEWELLTAGQQIETETFIPFMNQWVSYLSHMDVKEQQQHHSLIKIVDKCSEQYNQSLNENPAP